MGSTTGGSENDAASVLAGQGTYCARSKSSLPTSLATRVVSFDLLDKQLRAPLSEQLS